MTIHAKNPPAGEADGSLECQLLAGVDVQEINQNRPTPQANLLRNPRAVREARLELLREAIFEACGFIRLHAEVCQSLAEAGDNAGLLHSLRQLIAYTKEAARTGSDLRAVREAASNKEAGQ